MYMAGFRMLDERGTMYVMASGLKTWRQTCINAKALRRYVPP
jgi:hypothetical protein